MPRFNTEIFGLAALALPILQVVTSLGARADEPEMVGLRFEQMNEAPPIEVNGLKIRADAAIRTGYTDNVNWTPQNPVATANISIRGSVNIEDEIGPHTLRMSASYANSKFEDAATSDASALSASGEATVEFRPNLRLRATASFIQSEEPTASNGIVVDGVYTPYSDFVSSERAPFDVDLFYDTGKFRFVLSEASTWVDYETQTTDAGLMVSQSFRSGWEHELSARAEYYVYASLAAFVNATAGANRYELQSADSDDFSLSAGVNFELSRLIKAQLYAGYAMQDYTVAGEASGFIYGGEVTWFASPLLSVSLQANREFHADVTTSAAGQFSSNPATADRIALVAEWEPLRQLLVRLNAGYSIDETEQGRRHDEMWSVGLHADYVMTRNMRARIDIEHQTGKSNVIGDVERNSVNLGVTTAY